MTGPAILCAGEAVIDLIPDGDLLRPVPGGAAFNAARAAARLGAEAGFFGALSRDGFGDRLADAARADGVDLSLALRVDAPTPLSVADLTEGDARYTIHDAGGAGHEVTRDRLPALPGSVRALLVGGFSLIAPPEADAFEALALTRPGGVALMVDLNIRPGLIRDATTYRARLSRLMAAADVVKVSDEDLGWLGCAAEDVAPHALVLHTRGAAGARALRPGLTVTVPAPRMPVADTVGAGDVFDAAWLAFGLGAGQFAPDTEAALRAALDFACRAASLSCTRPGATGPTRQEMTCAPSSNA